MKKNLVHSGSEFTQKVMTGLKKVDDAVSSTLGPDGNCVAIEKEYGVPHVTKDGVTVAKAINLECPVENIGAQLVREAADRTNKEAGDGTTTATVLSRALAENGMKYVTSGVSGVHLKNGLDKISKELVKFLDGMKTTVETKADKNSVAIVSSNGDYEIAECVADAYDTVGLDGVITIENSSSTETSFEVTEGYTFDSGWSNQYFVTNTNKMESVHENPVVFVADENIDSFDKILWIQSAMTQYGGRPFVFIANDFSNEIATRFIQMKMSGQIAVVFIKSPGFGNTKRENLEDIATITGTSVFSTAKGDDFSAIKPAQLGTCKKIVVKQDETTITQNEGAVTKKLTERIDSLKAQLENTESDFESEKIQKRIAKIQGGVGVIYVGANTEAELKEKKDRFEDAISAVRAAMEEGVVPGGSYALLKMMDELENNFDKYTLNLSKNELWAREILIESLKAPFVKMFENAGLSSEYIMKKMIEDGKKYDLRTREYLDVNEKTLIDPLKVVRLAFLHAVSVAGIILTMNAGITIVKEKSPFPDMSGMMGG